MNSKLDVQREMEELQKRIQEEKVLAKLNKLEKGLEARDTIAVKLESGLMFQTREMPDINTLHNTLQQWTQDLKAIKPDDRGATDRYYAMAISKAQDLIAFLHYYCIDKKGLDQ